MIKVILIDIDNTLLDFDASVREITTQGFKKFNLDFNNDNLFAIFDRVNTELWTEIEQGKLTLEGLRQTRWNRIFSMLNISFDGCIFEDYFGSSLFNSAIPVDGAADALEYLKERYILCTASNGPFKQQVNRLKTGGMLSYFSEIFVSEKIGASKPSKKFFFHCLNELNKRAESKIYPSEVIMIGDSLTSDIKGSYEMGFKTCFFDKNMSGKTGSFPIDYIITSLDDIRTFL